ncbi:MAG: magnesium transporter [Anaerolineae bacterium]|nr:MAG: magnesium transporter [Anaerolineae bacterium]
MSIQNIDQILDLVQYALEQEDLDQAIRYLSTLKSPDQADIFEELEEDEQAVLLQHLSPEDSADILEDMEDEEAAELADALPLEKLARIIDEMEPDEAADLLGDVSPEKARYLLTRLEDAAEIRPLLIHPDDSAGGLMTSEFLVLLEDMTCAEALTTIRYWNPEQDDISYFFVADEERHLRGVVSLLRLVSCSPTVRVGSIMDRDVISIRAGADQEEAARLMSRYDLLALPVVNERNVIVGVITVDDVLDVLEEEATEDIQRLGGAEPLDQPYLLTSAWELFRKRIGWLMLLFVTGSLTGTVLRIFEEDLSRVVSLSIFIPLLIGTGGNAGSQTTNTIIRALAVGDIDLKDAFLTLWHEVRVGVLIGVGMGIFGYIRAIMWHVPPEVAFTVAIAIFAVVVWATSMGSILPVVATALKIDPTVVSGPVMSTLVDATGLLIYFTIARMVVLRGM